MFVKFLRLTLLPLLLFTSLLCADPIINQDPTVHRLVTTYFCTGDDHGSFVNDFVAVLSDGSAWKVHPQDSDLYAQWTNDDVVHIQVRTSFYWFKREHKFELQNFSRNQSVRVMLMQYPMYPLTIVAVHNVEIGGRYVTETYKNVLGELVSESRWVPDFAFNLYLSDGTVWQLDGQNKHNFEANDYVYFSSHRETDKAWHFLIKGKQREARWQKVQRVL